MSAASGAGGAAARGMREVSELDAAVLSALFESPISLYVLDTELRLLRFNPSPVRIRDFPLAEMVGRPAAEALRHHPDRALDDGILRALWLDRHEMAAAAPRLRSPMVLASVDDWLAGRRLPLDAIRHLPPGIDPA